MSALFLSIWIIVPEYLITEPALLDVRALCPDLDNVIFYSKESEFS